ncbi:AsmA family protein [Sphingomonas sp. ID0503]|uniref:AsmA family protein n=1 Tax=Sphingomonas sp. ID0503 TaxID=3399691 RepID=UPI003AFA9C8E
MATSAPAPRRWPRTERGQGALGIGLSIFATIIGLIVLAWAILFITKGRFLKHTFERIVSGSTERKVTVAGDFQLYFAPFKLKFLADGLTVTNPAWAPRPNFWESKHLEIWVSPWSLVFGDRYKIYTAELIDGRADLEWDDANKRNTWTFGDPNQKGEPFTLPLIKRAMITGTELHYRDPLLQLVTDIKVNTVRAQNTAVTQDISFTGDGTMRGKAFVMNGAIVAPNATLEGDALNFRMHATSIGNILDVTGKLPGVTEIEGGLFNLYVRGPNLARLFDFIGVAVPDTRRYRLRSDLTKVGEEWRFTRMRGGFGDSDLAGKMTISMPAPEDRLKIVADLSSNKVDIIDIGPFMGYEPNALATKGAVAAVEQTGGAPRILPDAPLRIESLKIFDAHVNYRVKTIRAPSLPVSNIKLTFDLDHTLLKLSPLTMDVAGGHLASDIEINARTKPVETTYDIRLSPTPMGRLLSGFGVSNNGTTGTVKARVKMSGEGDTVRESLASSDGRIAIILPKGDFWTQYIQLAEFDVGTFVQKMFQDKLKKPVEINCGLIAFTVRDGNASADPILIDTKKNVMLGTGGFSFKDESLDIRFRADAKKISLFSGQSPVGISGHFAAPGIQIITPELLARGGVGAAAALAVGPLAGILAFVDPGDAKGAACGPVLSGASAAAQKTKDGESRDDVGDGKSKKKKD